MIATIVPFSLLSLAPPPPLAEKAGPVDKTVFIAPRPMISHNFGPELMALTCSDPFNADRCSEHDLHCKEVMKDPSKQGTFFLLLGGIRSKCGKHHVFWHERRWQNQC